MDVFRVVADSGVVGFVRTHKRSVGIVTAVFVPLVAVIAALGGFEEAEADPSTTRPGEVIRTEPLDVTIHEARIGRTQPGYGFKVDDRYILTVRATVTSRSDLPLTSGSLRDLVRWPEKERPNEKVDFATALKRASSAPTAGDRARSVQAYPDAKSTAMLNPGLASDLLYVWELPDSSPPPKTLNLSVMDFEFAESTTLKRKNAWLPTDPVATLSLPVEPEGP